jgi:CheY-like chemotaxis protein
MRSGSLAPIFCSTCVRNNVCLLEPFSTGLHRIHLQRSTHCLPQVVADTVAIVPQIENSACSRTATPFVWNSGKVDTHSSEAIRSRRATLLWIDDFEPGLMLYKKMFEDLGFTVVTANSGELGIQIAAINRIDVVVTDYEMPGMDGFMVAKSIKALNPQTPVLLFSGSSLVPLRARRVVDAQCDKAGSRSELLDAIHRLLERKGSQSLQPPPVAQASDHGHRTVA